MRWVIFSDFIIEQTLNVFHLAEISEIDGPLTESENQVNANLIQLEDEGMAKDFKLPPPDHGKTNLYIL